MNDEKGDVSNMITEPRTQEEVNRSRESRLGRGSRQVTELAGGIRVGDALPLHRKEDSMGEQGSWITDLCLLEIMT